MRRIGSGRSRRGHRAVGLVLATVTAALVASCGWFPVRVGPDHVTGSTNVFYHDLDGVNDKRPLHYSISIGSNPKDLYLVLTNPTTGTIGTPTIKHHSAVSPHDEPAPRYPSPAARAAAIAELASGPVALRDHPDLAGWEPPPLQRGTRGTFEPRGSPPAFTAVPAPDRYNPDGGTNTYDFYYDSTASPIPSILAARRENVGTLHGPKTLEIWVEEAEWMSTIQPGMVTAMADAFLLEGYDNDIYDWVSAVFGEEWSDEAASYGNTIQNHDTITILLYDIDGDRAAGGIVGFFWAKDNFLRSEFAHSNERIMFYIDSATYGATVSGESEWSITNFWPNEIVSTLAHELQHMINFHERWVLRDAGTPTWLDEAMSLAAEDLVEHKRGRRGPRGVDPVAHADGSAGPSDNRHGRLPLYNLANDISLTAWGASPDILESYSMAYAFAAFLGRNYGGARLFAEMSRNASTNPNTMLASSIVAAGGPPGMTLKQLLWQWGAAVLLSDDSRRPPYRLNPGMWMTSTSGGFSYSLGSIDHYRYRDNLFVRTGAIEAARMEPASKMLYLVGTGLTGTVEIDIEFQRGMDLTVVVK